MPGAMGTRYVAGCPPSRSPRNTSKIASAIAPPLFSGVAPASRPRPGGATNLFFFRNQLLQFAGHFGYQGLTQRHCAPLANDYIIFRSPGWVEAWMIKTAVSSAALFARKRAAGGGLGNRQHRL